MYEQLSKELKASLFQRIKSPFFGSFLIGLFIFNYRVLFILLSDKPLEDKFNLIDTSNLIMNIPPLNIPIVNFQIASVYLTTLIYPFLFALFYIGLVPYFEYYISMPIWKKHQNRLKEKYAKLEKEEIFLGTEKDKYLSEILNLKKEKNKLIEELTNIDIVNEEKIDKIKEEMNELCKKEKEKINEDFDIKLKTEKNILKENYESQLEEANIKLEECNEKIETHIQTIKNLEKKEMTLTEELERKNNELENYKNEEKSKNDFNNKRFEKYLEEYSKDELNLLRIIYEHNIQDNRDYSYFIDDIVKISDKKRIACEQIIKKLIEKRLIIKDHFNTILYPDSLKEFIYEIFSSSDNSKIKKPETTEDGYDYDYEN
ncbi:hypothetical protein [Aliarcobacter butzleri]|uniref:hypothetical protein n=1 Tax=Aliarcobacter butzleri TaxID=28197 RepID=UPI002B24F310|nr:hypothetical protein [Aliarcobacter butzleri]